MKTWHWIAALAGVAVVASYREPWRMGRRAEAADLSPDQLAAARERRDQQANDRGQTRADPLTGEPIAPLTGKRGRPGDYISPETKHFHHIMKETRDLGSTLRSRGHVFTEDQLKYMEDTLYSTFNDIKNDSLVCSGRLLPGPWVDVVDKHGDIQRGTPYGLRKYKSRERKGEDLAEALAKGKPARVRGGDRVYTPLHTPVWSICEARPGTKDTGKIRRIASIRGELGAEAKRRKRAAKKAAEEAS